MSYIPHSQRVIQVDNTKVNLFFFKFNPTNPTAIVLHGLRADTERMLPVIKLLENRFNIISLDLPGFGKSKSELYFDNYISFCGDLMEKLLDKLELKKSEIILFGASNGANIILEQLLKEDSIKYKRVILFAPIYSYQNISMDRKFKKFVDFLVNSLEKSNLISNSMQRAINSDRVFNFFAKTVDKKCSDKSVLDYERKQWRLMSIKHWGITLKHFLKIDLSKIKKQYDQDNIQFIFPEKDQYLDIESTVKGFKNIFPNASFKFFESTEHIPRGDFLSSKSGASLQKIIDEI